MRFIATLFVVVGCVKHADRIDPYKDLFVAVTDEPEVSTAPTEAVDDAESAPVSQDQTEYGDCDTTVMLPADNAETEGLDDCGSGPYIRPAGDMTARQKRKRRDSYRDLWVNIQ
ncbi:MAG: hypothetical protein WAZ14_03375 [Patescibacteria group bacterium]